MRTATFNANSIRNRIEVILGWMHETDTDLLCVQETKCQDKDFPEAAVREAGLYCAYNGQKTFNGVALISRHPLENVVCGTGNEELDTEARFISAVIGDVLFVNTYIPQGQSIGSDKFVRKLKYLDFMYDYFHAGVQCDNIIWCGDFNIALTDRDVYDPDSHRGGVGFCEEEQTRLMKIMELGFSDTFRQLHPEEEKAFTFWDYRIPYALKRGLGWRIDYIMASSAMANRLSASEIDISPRQLPKASDHTFLLSDFNYSF